MKKVYLFDSFGYDFYACEFDGLDADGKPRLTIMTPGCPVENFRDYLEVNLESEYDYCLLCEDGKQADSELIVKMFGQMFLNRFRPYGDMLERLEQLRRCGIDYDRESQKLTAKIQDFVDESKDGKRYSLMLYVGEQEHYIGESYCTFASLKDICFKLAGFFYFMESQTHIPLRKCLEVSEDVKKQMKRFSPSMFDTIDVL